MVVRSNALLSGTEILSLVPSKDNDPSKTLLLTTEPDTATLTVAASVEVIAIFPLAGLVFAAAITTYIVVEATDPELLVKVSEEAKPED